ncbi:MAG: long-chain fatty acid--CoA ligase [Planctomycetaceae bacterium]|nr:long-chain fatty acid--CoA ligase [Planctomycetaceae bacterium]
MPRLALFDAAEDAHDQVVVIDAAGSYTYADLLDHSRRVATALLDGSDDLSERRIAFLVTPGFDYVAVQWGIWQAGGVAVPLGLKHPRPELAYTIDDADVSAVVVEPELKDRVAAITTSKSLPLLATDDFPERAVNERLPAIEAFRRAMILYTSGSTGKPKGVVTTHANIQAQIDALVEAWEWQRTDKILHVLPMHHIHGIINVLGCAMRVAATCEFLPTFEPVRVWERFAVGDLTLFMAVPTIYVKLIAAFENASSQLQTRWSNGAGKMRLMVSGSAALPIPTLEKWEAITGNRLLERYGMTEIGMGLSNPLHGERRAGHVGAPLPSVEARRTNEAGEIVDDAAPGEIEIRGPSVFQEYWNRPEATAKSFRDGWFRTGDIAVVDDGAYRILGRSSVDIIKTGGYKVSALEIEDVLRTHSAIRDCAVVGIEDAEWGERVALCAVCDEAESIALDELRDWAKERLASYKVPTLLHVCDELPRNAMSKVQKPRVRELFQ